MAERLDSHPLSTLPSQLSKPVAQRMPHAPTMHEAVPLVALQTLLHRPQWAIEVVRLASHPSAFIPLQSAYPGLQLKPQVPTRQVT